MNFNIDWSNQALKFLNNLPKETCLRIWNKIDKLKDNPFRYLEHFEGENCFKLRIGEFRALIDVNMKDNVLKVLVLDKRGRIYKR